MNRTASPGSMSGRYTMIGILSVQQANATGTLV
jgi:hypothetical protein